jgi:hypothetical protein
MNRIFLIIFFGIIGMMSSAFADTKTIMISVNKSVPLSIAAKKASELEFRDPNNSTCYMQVQVSQYIPYSSCETDLLCPYWGVALVRLDWNCDLPLRLWLDRINSDKDYTIYYNGKIGPFPIVSGGN